MFAPQNPIAPPNASTPALGWRTNAMAVRVPCAKVAGAVASRRASLPKRPEVWRSIRRSKSFGSRAINRPSTSASAANAAGITVPESGASPERAPTRSRTPKTIRATR